MLRPLIASLLAVAASSFFAGLSRADNKRECAAFASRGQTLRNEHHLAEAREQFQSCARRECPAVIQIDCGGWLAEVEKLLPTVVFSAKDSSENDLFDVTVAIDGAALVSKLDGKALAMDPGVHVFEFTREDGTRVTERALIKEGQKAQSIAVRFGLPPSPHPSPSDPTPARVAAPAPVGPIASSGRRDTQRLIGAIAAGTGISAVGFGIVLGVMAKASDDRAASEPGAARQSDSQAAVRQANAATVVCILGGVAVAAGATLWFTAPKAPAAIGTNGQMLFVQGSF